MEVIKMQPRIWANILVHEFVFLNSIAEEKYLLWSSSHTLTWRTVAAFCSFCQSFKGHYLAEQPPKKKTINS